MRTRIATTKIRRKKPKKTRPSLVPDGARARIAAGAVAFERATSLKRAKQARQASTSSKHVKPAAADEGYFEPATVRSAGEIKTPNRSHQITTLA